MPRPQAYSYIRFSTKEQRKGSSLHRQMTQTRKFAERHGLDLHEKTYEDLGVSAFRGHHARTGALSLFIEAVREGKIPPGSWLLIESLDRLGRDQLNAAFSRFQQLLELGITVATLGENKVFRPEGASDLGEIMVSLVSMSRAHEESMRKSQLSAGAWDKTRETSIATGKAPAKGGVSPWWLKKNKDGSFSEIPDRCDAIRQMFRWSLEGYGSTRLARMMTENYGHLDSEKAWTTGVISNVTRGRMVLGEWQPRRQAISDDGIKRYEPIGDPVKLYPAIVEEGVWLRVQQQRKARDIVTGRGATAEGIPNLFSGLLKCSCGTAVRLNHKASFVCRTVEYGRACEHRQGVRRTYFEPLVLIALEKYLRSHAFPSSPHEALTKELDGLESNIASTKEEYEAAKRKAANALEMLLEDDGTLRDTLKKRARDLEQEAGSTEQRLISLEDQRSVILAKLSQPQGEEEQITELLAQMTRDSEGRHKVSHALHKLVESMTLSGTRRTLTIHLKETYGTCPIEVTWNKPIRGRLKSLDWSSSSGGVRTGVGRIEQRDAVLSSDT